MGPRKWSKARKKQRQKEGKSGEDERNKKNEKYGQERDPYALVEAGNFKLEAFYAYQGIHDHYLDEATGTFLECTTNEQKEAERKRWLASLKAILPASFRIGNDVDSDLRERLERELEEYAGKEMEIEVEPKGLDRRVDDPKQIKTEKKMIAPAKKIGYVPHAYQLSLDRQTIRRNTSLNGFHEWLKVQTQAGFVTRQETVSMIPPVVLNPEPHHKVLDMCAAPGSKTSQLLELVNLPAKPGDTEPLGYVVANDSDYKRAYMLVHQMRRINSPAIFISCCDAQFFPLVRSEEHPTEGLFDRVLCDVPCAGDGTARKNPGIWKRWNQLNAIGLHNVQLGIALKGARLTRVGGYMVYSTCSMNPMENESVVAELLRSSEGSLELVDHRSAMKGMLARPGMSTWKVLSETKSRRDEKNLEKKNNDKMKDRRKAWEEKNNGDNEKEASGSVGEEKDEEMVNAEGSEEQQGTAVDSEEKKNGDQAAASSRPVRRKFEPTSMDEAALKEHVTSIGLHEFATFEEVPKYLTRRIRQSCFPPTKEEAERFHLDRCMRILPQDMDTGGFFVCLLKKVAPMNARARARFEKLQEELKEENDEADETKNEEPAAKKSKIESAADTETPGDNGDELMKNEKDSAGVVRGHVKKIFLKDKDGKAHETLGRDDFIPIADDVFGPLKDFYGLSSDSFDEGNYMSRACGDGKVLYFITKSIKALIDTGIQERLTTITSGVKGFTRCSKDCSVGHRIAQEGVHFVAPHMTKRKLIVDLEDFQKCLVPGNLEVATFSEGFAKEVRALSFGSFVVCLRGFENDYLKKLVLVVWRCRSDMTSTMANQAELDGMKSRLRSINNEATVPAS
jgi:16S rRNA C967 or C1407 C5-methylase (RsmB/RsmF family)